MAKKPDSKKPVDVAQCPPPMPDPFAEPAPAPKPAKADAPAIVEPPDPPRKYRRISGYELAQILKADRKRARGNS